MHWRIYAAFTLAISYASGELAELKNKFSYNSLDVDDMMEEEILYDDTYNWDKGSQAH